MDRRCSALRARYFDVRLPDMAATRSMRGAYRPGALQIPHTSAMNPGTIGTAFGLGFQALVSPDSRWQVAYQGALAAAATYRVDPVQMQALVVGLQAAADIAAACGDFYSVATAALAGALWVEVYRIGMVHSNSPLQDLRELTAEATLQLIAADAAAETGALLAAASEDLLPRLARPVHLNPTFTCSALLPADADLIARRTLWELKTTSGRNDVRQERYDYFTAELLRQLLGYALFDTCDEFTIRRIGVYNARYRAHLILPVADVLEALAGEPVALHLERQLVYELLWREANPRRRAPVPDPLPTRLKSSPPRRRGVA